MGKRQRSVSEVHKILEDYGRSGLTVSKYCSRHNLNAGTFHWWLSRERKKKDKKSSNTVSSFIRLDASESTFPGNDSKREMSIEIELRNGVRTRIQAALSFSQLTDLLSICGR
jgi:transposase-like protein